MKRFLPLCLLGAAMLVGRCGYDDNGSYRPDGERLPLTNTDIGELRDNYRGEPLLVVTDLVVGGRVVANDKSGNFYRSFIVEDETGAVEIRGGLYDLHTLYPVGSHVAVSLEGLCVDSYSGVMQIGLPPDAGERGAQEFGHEAVLGRFITPGNDILAPQPQRITPSGLEEALCGRLVEIAGLRLVTEDEDGIPIYDGDPSWAVSRWEDEGPGTGYRDFADRGGERITVVTSGYADFAADLIPEDEMTLRGIVLHYKVNGRERFVLKLRDRNDIATEG